MPQCSRPWCWYWPWRSCLRALFAVQLGSMSNAYEDLCECSATRALEDIYLRLGEVGVQGVLFCGLVIGTISFTWTWFSTFDTREWKEDQSEKDAKLHDRPKRWRHSQLVKKILLHCAAIATLEPLITSPHRNHGQDFKTLDAPHRRACRCAGYALFLQLNWSTSGGVEVFCKRIR